MDDSSVIGAERPLTVAQVAEITGFSMRYWQRKASEGKLPGARYVETGARKTYRIDPKTFLPWWDRQLKEIKPCQKTSGSAAAFIGTGSQKTAPRTKARWKHQASVSLKSALRASDDS